MLFERLFDSLVSIDEASAAWFTIDCRFLAFLSWMQARHALCYRRRIAAMIDFGELDLRNR